MYALEFPAVPKFGNFSFRVVSLDKVKKAIHKNNKSTCGEIPVSILKECEISFSVFEKLY